MQNSEWSDYRVFLAVLRAGSLSLAARLLRLDQSTVGRRLAGLEAAVGARLFDRTPNGYALTAAGESVRADIEHIEQSLPNVERGLSGGDARIEGTIRIATTEAFASAFPDPAPRHTGRSAPATDDRAGNGRAPSRPRPPRGRHRGRFGVAPKKPNLVARRIGDARFAL
jgi:DNA-binding transcriptional LysR family regulator